MFKEFGLVCANFEKGGVKKVFIIRIPEKYVYANLGVSDVIEKCIGNGPDPFNIRQEGCAWYLTVGNSDRIPNTIWTSLSFKEYVSRKDIEMYIPTIKID